MDVRKEMVEEKGLVEDVADRIGDYVKLRGGFDLLDQLSSDQTLVAVEDARVGLEEMRVLLNYCQLFGVLDKVNKSASCSDYRNECCLYMSRCPLTSAWPVVWTITRA